MHGDTLAQLAMPTRTGALTCLPFSLAVDQAQDCCLYEGVWLKDATDSACIPYTYLCQHIVTSCAPWASLQATNPTVINEGLQGLTAGLTAVIATLRMEFAQTVTLGGQSIQAAAVPHCCMVALHMHTLHVV